MIESVFSAVDSAVESAVYSTVYSTVHSAVRVDSPVNSAVSSAVYSVYKTDNLREFCIVHKLHYQSMATAGRGKRHYKGWKKYANLGVDI